MTEFLWIPDPDDAAKRLQLTLVVDRSFFHDLFRKSYGGLYSADWLWAYFTVRQSIDLGPPVLLTAASILLDVRAEFRALKQTESDAPKWPVLLSAVQNWVGSVPLPAKVSPKHAVLYVAKIEADLGHFPVIVSSVGQENLKERAHSAGLDMKLDGFTPHMSRKRIDEGCWFFHVHPNDVPRVLLATDPLFQQVAQQVGFPPSPPSEVKPVPPQAEPAARDRRSK